MDRSLAAMAAKFLPLGAYIVRLRHFIDTRRRWVVCWSRRVGGHLVSEAWRHRQRGLIGRMGMRGVGCRYDYGMVAQALAAGLQTVLKDHLVNVSHALVSKRGLLRSDR